MSEPRTAWPDGFFAREDESPDEDFYSQSRFVTHVDDATIAALTEFYAGYLHEGADVLDLMSSWISHYPPDLKLGRVAGLGMNADELAGNPQLSEHRIQNLNTDPTLPYESGSFDAVTLVVSIQYLTDPVNVLRSAFDVLRPGGELCIAMSHRLFPTKAIAAFRTLSPQERVAVVQQYLRLAGFADVEFLDRSPAGADPLWLVLGHR